MSFRFITNNNAVLMWWYLTSRQGTRRDTTALRMSQKFYFTSLLMSTDENLYISALRVAQFSLRGVTLVYWLFCRYLLVKTELCDSSLSDLLSHFATFDRSAQFRKIVVWRSFFCVKYFQAEGFFQLVFIPFLMKLPYFELNPRH